MKVDECRSWFDTIIARRLIEMDFNVPPLVSGWDSDPFDYNTFMYPIFSYAKPPG